MKKRFLKILTALVFCCAAEISAAGMPVFDITGWLTALDQLYSAYDTVNNTITQIENQYRQIQQSVERAKSIDWENIRFDGDFDIRNDIRDATKRVNRLLTQANNIKKTVTTPSISCGNVKYSIADLCGAGEDGRNFSTAVSDYKYYMTETMKSAVDAVSKELTPEQRRAIWTKYGISPENYVFVQQSKNAVKNAASALMAKATDEAKQMQAEERIAKQNTIINAALENKDSDGNPTQSGMQEAQLHLTGELAEHLLQLEFTVNDIGGLCASKMIAEENERQAKADEQKMAEIQTDMRNNVSSRFKIQ